MSLPPGAFAPYSNVKTAPIFFERPGPTRETWRYELPPPPGLKKFSKGSPIADEHFAEARTLWQAWDACRRGRGPRPEPTERSWITTVDEIAARGYDLSARNPNRSADETRRSAVEIAASLPERIREMHDIVQGLYEQLQQRQAGGGVAMERWPLPEGWERRKLAEAVEPAERRDPSLLPDQRFAYVDISGINNQEGAISEAKTLPGREAPVRARKVIRRDDVIVATTRPYLRNVALVPAEYDNQICSTGFCVLRSRAGVAEPWHRYYLRRSEVLLDQLTPKMRGASYPAITDSDVLGCEILLPPLETQRRIVARLDALLAQAEAARRRRAEIAEDAARVMEAARDEMFSELAGRAPSVLSNR